MQNLSIMYCKIYEPKFKKIVLSLYPTYLCRRIKFNILKINTIVMIFDNVFIRAFNPILKNEEKILKK